MSMRMALQLSADPAQEPIDNGQLTLDFAGPKRFPAIQSEAEVTNISVIPDRIDAALEEMRDFLSVLHPSTDAEALQSLRLAFPTVPLVDRIAAIRTRFFA